MKNVYLAASLFSEGERDLNTRLRDELTGLGMSVFLLQEHSNDTNAQRDAKQEAIFSVASRFFKIYRNVSNIYGGSTY
ncbi:MAG: hypothetical protein IBX40_06880 [Methanosarcinales archaeon]|nr:hypothetical protein [Methanosarcinales archaeon]